MDWNKIKTEYVTTDTSYRKLAQKYNVTATQIANHAGREGWVKEREQYLKRTYSKTVTVLSNAQAQRVARIMSITDKILAKLDRAVDAMNESDITIYKQLTAAIKDIKDIQMLKSDADMREQEARISNLRKQSESDGTSKTVNVVMAKDTEPYSE